MGNTAYCIWSYSMSPMGDAGATSGNSQACRDYHLGAAMSSGNAMLHCPHASGEAVCVDDVTTMAPMVQTHTISWGFQGVDVASLTIQVGDTVMWNFDQQSIHTITSGSSGDADAGSMFNSGDMAVGTSFMYTFDTAGTYPYFCARHPAFMMATITVEEAGGGGGSPAEMFCQGFWDTCSAYNPYADMAACVMDFEMVPMGETTDTSGTETSISLLTYPPYEGSWQSCRSHSPPLSLS
jgi:plastocyanin